MARLAHNNNTVLIRASTNRPELKYHRIALSGNTNQYDVIARLAYTLQTSIFQSHSRGIIFCRGVAEAQQLAQILDCLVYYSAMEDSARTESKKNWSEGNTPGHQWIVATSAFIHGIDEPYVDAIIFCSLPWGMIEFVQG